jgi:hypothetical protein
MLTLVASLLCLAPVWVALYLCLTRGPDPVRAYQAVRVPDHRGEIPAGRFGDRWERVRHRRRA